MNLKRMLSLAILMLTACSTVFVETNAARKQCLRGGCNNKRKQSNSRSKHQVKQNRKGSNLAKKCLIGMCRKNSNSRHAQNGSRKHHVASRSNRRNSSKGCQTGGCQKSRTRSTRSSGRSRNCSNGRCGRRSNLSRSMQKKSNAHRTSNNATCKNGMCSISK